MAMNIIRGAMCAAEAQGASASKDPHPVLLAAAGITPAAVTATVAKIVQSALAPEGETLAQTVEVNKTNTAQFLSEKGIKNPKVLSTSTANGKVAIKGGEKLTGYGAIALRVLETVFLPLLYLIAVFSQTYRNHLDNTVLNGVSSKQDHLVSQPSYDATVMLRKMKVAHKEAQAKVATLTKNSENSLMAVEDARGALEGALKEQKRAMTMLTTTTRMSVERATDHQPQAGLGEKIEETKQAVATAEAKVQAAAENLAEAEAVVASLAPAKETEAQLSRQVQALEAHVTTLAESERTAASLAASREAADAVVASAPGAEGDFV